MDDVFAIDLPVYGEAKVIEGSVGRFSMQPTVLDLGRAALPDAGGVANVPVGQFDANHDQLLTFSAAYARVSGCRQPDDGPGNLLVTSVIEGLNILDVLTIERIVTQVSVVFFADKPRQFSFAGSRIEGLYVAGCGNLGTLDVGDPSGGSATPLAWSDIQAIAQGQTAQPDRKFMATKGPKGSVMLSLLGDILTSKGSKACHGHAVDIPGFGRVSFGEVTASELAVQVAGLQADLDLGCAGQVHVVCAMTSGTGHPP
jgi:hypothetical protein